MERDHRTSIVLVVFVVAIVVLFMAFSFRVCAQETKSQSDKKQPARIVLVTDKNKTLRYSKEDGLPLMNEMFVFDQEKKRAWPTGAPPLMKMTGVPVPVSISLFSTIGSVFMTPIYANTIWEVKDFAELPFGELYSTKGDTLADIFIVSNNIPVVYVSSDYIVFPAASRQVEKGGPFASVLFQLQAEESKASTADFRLTVNRNGKKVIETILRKNKDFRLDLVGVKTSNDVLNWVVEDSNTKTSRRGTVAFPVRGARAGLVLYRVRIMIQDANLYR